MLDPNRFRRGLDETATALERRFYALDVDAIRSLEAEAARSSESEAAAPNSWPPSGFYLVWHVGMGMILGVLASLVCRKG